METFSFITVTLEVSNAMDWYQNIKTAFLLLLQKEPEKENKHGQPSVLRDSIIRMNFLKSHILIIIL